MQANKEQERKRLVEQLSVDGDWKKKKKQAERERDGHNDDKAVQ